MWVLAAMGLMAVLGGVLGTCGLVAGVVALNASSSDESGGVILGAQVPQTITDALRSRKLLGPREELLAYHDLTIRLDMSEVTFVTATRVVYAHGETLATMELADVVKIAHHTETLLGDVIDVTRDDGAAMRIQIAPLNGGESFVNVLESAWQKRRPGMHVDHAKR